MGLNNIGRNYDEPKLSQSEIEHEVLHYLLSIGFSGDSFISATQVIDEQNPDSIKIEFSYYDKVKGIVRDVLNLKNINIIKKTKINSSNLDDQNADYIFNIARQREEEKSLAKKLAEQGRAAQERDIAIAAKLAEFIKLGGKFNGLGSGKIIYDFTQFPKVLGDKGFPEKVDLTREKLPIDLNGISDPKFNNVGKPNPKFNNVGKPNPKFNNVGKPNPKFY